MEVKEKRTYISPNVVTVAPLGTEGSLLDGLETGSGEEPSPDAKYHTSYSMWEDEEEESYE